MYHITVVLMVAIKWLSLVVHWIFSYFGPNGSKNKSSKLSDYIEFTCKSNKHIWIQGCTFFVFAYFIVTFPYISILFEKKKNSYRFVFTVWISISSLSVGDQWTKWNKWESRIVIPLCFALRLFHRIIVMLEVLQKSRSRRQ